MINVRRQHFTELLARDTVDNDQGGTRTVDDLGEPFFMRAFGKKYLIDDAALSSE
jgi:hypothetical protein